MKKLLTIAAIAMLAIFALVFTGCDNNGGQTPRPGEVGSIGPGGGVVFFSQGGQFLEVSATLGSGTWDYAMATARDYHGGGFDDWVVPNTSQLRMMWENRAHVAGLIPGWYWSSTPNSTQRAQMINFHDRQSGRIDPGGIASEFRTATNHFRMVRSASIADYGTGDATLVILNEASFSEITDVIWHGSEFTRGEGSIRPGSNAERIVQSGTGFIFFRRVNDPIDAQTVAIVTVQPGERYEFRFLNSTLIAEQADPANIGRFDQLGR